MVVLEPVKMKNKIRIVQYYHSVVTCIQYCVHKTGTRVALGKMITGDGNYSYDCEPILRDVEPNFTLPILNTITADYLVTPGDRASGLSGV